MLVGPRYCLRFVCTRCIHIPNSEYMWTRIQKWKKTDSVFFFPFVSAYVCVLVRCNILFFYSFGLEVPHISQFFWSCLVFAVLFVTLPMKTGTYSQTHTYRSLSDEQYVALSRRHLWICLHLSGLLSHRTWVYRWKSFWYKLLVRRHKCDIVCVLIR